MQELLTGSIVRFERARQELPSYLARTEMEKSISVEVDVGESELVVHGEGNGGADGDVGGFQPAHHGCVVDLAIAVGKLEREKNILVDAKMEKGNPMRKVERFSDMWYQGQLDVANRRKGQAPEQRRITERLSG
jgi:hypothetical protein